MALAGTWFGLKQSQAWDLRTYELSICRLDEFVDPKPGMHHLDSFGFYCGHLVWHEDPQISYQISKDWFTHLLFWIVLVGFLTFADNFSPEDSRTLRWPNPRVNANPSPGPQVFRWRALVLSDVFFCGGGRARHKFTKRRLWFWFEGVFFWWSSKVCRFNII